jgi:hypothetical protein
VAALTLALGASRASAVDIGHVFSTSFKGALTNELGAPMSVDVDNSNGPSAGNVYVTDSTKHRVEKFDAAGNFVLMFGDEVNATTSGDVCTLASGNTCKAGNSGNSAEQLATPNWLAVDQTSGPSKGDVYVVNQSNNSVHKYDEGGALITSWGTGGAITGTNSESFGNVIGVDVDASGNLNVANDSAPPRIWRIGESGSFVSIHPFGGGRGTSANGFAVSADDHVFKANGSPGVQRSNATGTQPVEISNSSFPSTTGIAVDPTSGTLYQTNAGTQIAEYKFDGSGVPLSAQNVPCAQTLSDGGSGCPPTHVFGDPQLSGAKGSGVNAVTKTLYVADSGNGRVAVFIAAQAAIVTTGEPSGDKTVTGSVQLDGAGNITECYFEWGTVAGSYTKPHIPCEPATLPYTSDQSVEATIPEMEGETTYHYRLFAESAGGGSNVGVDKTITPHNVKGLTTLAATNLTRTSAQLNASFEGTNETTHWYFNYGLTTAYGKQTAIPPGAIQVPTVGLTPLPFEVTDLEAGHTYHYQIVAENTVGLSKGKDLTLTTPPAVKGLTTDSPTNLKPTTVTLNGSYLGTNDATTYHFEWGPATSYSHTTLSVGPVSASGPQTVSSDIVGTVPGNTYHYRVVASNPLGTTYGEDVTFEAPQIPAIVSQSVSNLTATSVDLNASINPHSSVTTYHFEYGPSSEYGQTAPIPEGSLGASNTAQPVSVHLSDVTPHTIYHFQVVATNEYGTTESGDLSFNFYPPSCPNQAVRQETNADSLPDCRAYELVSPEDAGTAAIFTGPTPQSPTATSPSRMSFAGGIGAIPGVGDPANVKADLYMSTRTTTGWKTKYVGLPATMAQWSGGPPWNVIERNEYYAMAFEGVLTDPSMSHIGIWDRGYYYCNVNDYATCQVDGAEEGYFGLPDVPKGHSDAPYVVNTTTGNITDRWPTNVATVPFGEKFVGHTDASADMSHFIFTSNIPFTPGGLPGSSPPGETHPGGNPGSMYDNDTVNGTLSVVSLNEEEEPIEAMPVETSNDGSHILMTVGGARQFGTFAKTSGPGQLFMRVDDARTYDIAAGHNVQYVDMTPDGSKVYFTSSDDLTPDSSDTDTSRDLYMWSEASNSPNHITLISKGNDGTTGNTDSCNASWTTKCGVGIITFAGFTTNEVNYERQYTDQVGGAGGAPEYEDVVAPGNGDIYFISPEQLDGDFGVPNAENLYDFRNGKLQFVTALTPETPSCVYSMGGAACSARGVARMEITPNDEHMAFLTSSQVTDYDNAGHSEIYLYTPATGDLRCTSCLPSGDPPSMDVTASHDGRFLANDGRTFFNTNEPLVLQDTNQATDVYEYVDGRPQLITSGTATANNSSGLTTLFSFIGLIGVSADGTDVYFSTTDTLVGQDRNGDNVKIYDARTAGGFPFVAPPPGCAAADECHGASSSAPAGLTTGTRADLGASGNLPAVKKKAQRKQRRHKRHARHKRAHRGGQRNG